MLERVFEIENRRIAKNAEAASERLRTAGRKAVPGSWRVVPNEDGTTRLLARDDQEVAVFAGMWASPTSRYVAGLEPTLIYDVAELLSQAAPEVRRGALPSPLTRRINDLATGILNRFGEP